MNTKNKQLQDSLSALEKLSSVVKGLADKRIEEAVKELEVLQRLIRTEADSRKK